MPTWQNRRQNGEHPTSSEGVPPVKIPPGQNHLRNEQAASLESVPSGAMSAWRNQPQNRHPTNFESNLSATLPTWQTKQQIGQPKVSNNNIQPRTMQQNQTQALSYVPLLSPVQHEDIMEQTTEICVLGIHGVTLFKIVREDNDLRNLISPLIIRRRGFHPFFRNILHTAGAFTNFPEHKLRTHMS